MKPAVGRIIAVAAFGACFGAALAQADDLKPFPPAEPGMQRVVIRVPAVPAPDDRRVEILIGKIVEVDCNRQTLSARVTRRVAQGWGFPCYVVSDMKGPASTLIACPPDTPKRQDFVRANAAELSWLRYNPRLPIVVYVPDGVEVRYRAWSAAQSVEQGKVE